MVKRSNRYIPVTAELVARVAGLRECRLTPGSWDNQFLREMSMLRQGGAISLSQAEWISRLCHRYRNQLNPQHTETATP